MSKKYEKFIQFIEENEMEEVIKGAVEKVVIDEAKYLEDRIEKLEKENKDYFERLQVFENYIAIEDSTQGFINSIKSHMELCIEEGFAPKDYDWAIEKQMIQEYQSELDVINND